MAASGEARVAEFVEEAVVAEEVGGFARHALGFVDGEGVAVGEVAAVDVVAGDGDGVAVVERDGEIVAGGADDGATAAVEEIEVVPVAVGDDSVAEGVVGGVVLPDGRAEGAGAVKVESGSAVEVGDVAALGGDHDGVEPVGCGGVPVGDEGVAEVVGVVGDGEVARSVEVGQCPVDVVGSQGGKR